MRALALAALLAACCSTPELPVPPRPPPELVCPAEPPVPPRLAPVVSIQHLAEAYHTLDLARQAERHRGNLCADSARVLKQWIKDQQ